MNFLEKIDISWKVLKGIIFKRRSPLVVVWHSTYRCNLQCKYCGYCERKTDELDTNRVFNLFDEVFRFNTKFIVITGGEPLIREDLGDIIDFCQKKSIFVSINTNGTLLKEKIDCIRNVDAIKLSLDGPPHINDAVKGKGAHDKVTEAIRICKNEGIKVNITTVISKYNISHIPYILNIAKEYNIEVFFQPADQTHCGNINKNILSEIPDEADFKKIITFLIEEKSKGNSYINNSIAGLRHLYHWPKPRRIFCLVGLLSFFISPDGRIFICDMFPYSQSYLVPIGSSFKETFDNLSLPYPCRQCWTASPADFNLLAGLRPKHILETWKKF